MSLMGWSSESMAARYLGEIAAGLVAQGMTILDSVKGSLGTAADKQSALRPQAEIAPRGAGR